MGAVDEMIVNAAGNDPEIATPGMAFQVIIKSGGNSFHGDGLYAFQTRGLQGNNIDDNLRSLGVPSGNPMDFYYDLNGSLGGRLIRDRLWFFGAAAAARSTGRSSSAFPAAREATTVTSPPTTNRV